MMIEESLDMTLITDILIFLVFSIFVFIWYKFYGNVYSFEEEESCKEILMYGYCIDLNQLAEKNSPYFWYCFQQSYPQFHIKLKEVDPTLKISEFKFCAYLYLGYTVSEIAEYSDNNMEFLKNKECLLKERLRLGSKESLHLWLKNKFS